MNCFVVVANFLSEGDDVLKTPLRVFRNETKAKGLVRSFHALEAGYGIEEVELDDHPSGHSSTECFVVVRIEGQHGSEIVKAFVDRQSAYQFAMENDDRERWGYMQDFLDEQTTEWPVVPWEVGHEPEFVVHEVSLD